MIKSKFLIKILLILLTISIVMTTFTGCEMNNQYNEEYIENLLSKSIKTLSDSDFTSRYLFRQIYINAFSKGNLVSEAIPKSFDDVITEISENNIRPELIKYMTDLYGGKNMTDKIEGLKSAPVKSVSQTDLRVGDLLLIKKENELLSYVYDKEGLVNLLAPLSEVDTESVLDSLADSNIFVVLRITNAMKDYCISEYEKETEQKLTDAQKAIVVTAQSYLIRSDKVQYAQRNSKWGQKYVGRYTTGVKSPEDYTTDVRGYTHCAAFCYDVYYNALDYKLKSNDIKLYSTKNLQRYSEEAGMRAYYMECDTSDSYTDKQKKQITNEILDTLEVGDILVVRRINDSGHAMLYIGNGNIIHSSGSDYDFENTKEQYEASIRQATFQDYFLTEGGSGYLFGNGTESDVQNFTIVRPLDVWDGEIPETTKNRIENLQNVMVQKTSSHNSTLNADVGEEITYTFELYNRNDSEITVDINDTVPSKTEYVSGADKTEGDNLCWEVKLAPNERKKVSFTVKVSADAQKGDIIESKSAKVGGVPVKCADIVVNHMLSKDEQQKIKDCVTQLENTTTVNGLKAVNTIYEKALGVNSVFKDTDFDTVYVGSDGVFMTDVDKTKLNIDGKYNKMLIPTLYGGMGIGYDKWGERTTLAREYNVVTGDVIIRKTAESNQVFIYVGDGMFYDLTEGIIKDSCTAKLRLESCLGTENCYAILRPSYTF